MGDVLWEEIKLKAIKIMDLVMSQTHLLLLEQSSFGCIGLHSTLHFSQVILDIEVLSIHISLWLEVACLHS